MQKSLAALVAAIGLAAMPLGTGAAQGSLRPLCDDDSGTWACVIY